MIALLIGVTTLAGMAFGWYGYKAHLRIETWGRKMNEIDGICQEESLADDGLPSYAGRKQEAVGVPLLPVFKAPQPHA